MEPWEFHLRQPPKDTPATPIVLWVAWEHRPDGVLGDVCLECLQPWPCPAIELLRTVAVATMNLPPDQLLDFARRNLEAVAEMQERERERAAEEGESYPVNLLAQRRRRRGPTE